MDQLVDTILDNVPSNMMLTGKKLDSLDVVLLEEIAGHLPAMAIGNLRLVNRQLNQDLTQVFNDTVFGTLKYMLVPASIGELGTLIQKNKGHFVRTLIIGPEWLNESVDPDAGAVPWRELRGWKDVFDRQSRTWVAERRRWRRNGDDLTFIAQNIPLLTRLRTIRLDNGELPNDGGWIKPIGAWQLLNNVDYGGARIVWRSWSRIKTTLLDRSFAHSHFGRVLTALSRIKNPTWTLELAFDAEAWNAFHPIDINSTAWQCCQPRVRALELISMGGRNKNWSINNPGPFTQALLSTCTQLQIIQIENEEHFWRVLAGRQWTLLSTLVIRDSFIEHSILQTFMEDHTDTLKSVIFDTNTVVLPGWVARRAHNGGLIKGHPDRSVPPLWPTIFRIMQQMENLKDVELQDLSSERNDEPSEITNPCVVVKEGKDTRFRLEANGKGIVKEALKCAVNATMLGLANSRPPRKGWYQVYSNPDNRVMFARSNRELPGDQTVHNPSYLYHFTLHEVKHGSPMKRKERKAFRTIDL